jgi:putative MATE family efflux protein
MVAQYFGAKEYKRLSECFGSSFTLIAIATVFIMSCAPLSGIILKLVKTPPEIFDMTYNFLFIMFIGCLGSGFYNIISGVLRGLGDAVFPLIVLLASVVLQVALDLLAILVLGWGLVGMGIATALSQLLSATACLIKVAYLKGVIQIKRETLIPKKEMVIQIIRLGLPAGISQGIMSLSFVFVQSIMNAMGPFIITCMTSVMRVDQFAMLPNMAFNTAASTFTGQNIGANRMDRVKKAGRRSY